MTGGGRNGVSFKFFYGVYATAIGTLAGGGGLINLPAMLLIKGYSLSH